MSLFDSLEVETFSLCNLRCPTCPVASAPRPAELLPEETFLRLVDEMAGIGFSGTFSPHFFNEPFADTRLPELMHAVADRLPAARIVVFTNTTLITPELLSRMPASVHSYVVTTDSPVIAEAHARLMPQLPPELREKFHTRSIASGALYNRGGMVNNLKGMRKVRNCVAASTYCTINAQGEVVLCFNDYEARHVFGNISHAPLLEIWNRPEFVAARGRILDGKCKGLLCAQCTSNAPEFTSA